VTPKLFIAKLPLKPIRSFLAKKKTRPLRGRVSLSLVLLSGFYSAQGILLSQLRRGSLAKKVVKAKKLVH
jgi:hypothetical protein